MFFPNVDHFRPAPRMGGHRGGREGLIFPNRGGLSEAGLGGVGLPSPNSLQGSSPRTASNNGDILRIFLFFL